MSPLPNFPEPADMSPSAAHPPPATDSGSSAAAPTAAASSNGAPLLGEPSEPPPGDLAAALRQLREAIAEASYPLLLPTADQAQRTGTELVDQLDDYLLPRLARLDAPLLVVVGGSTGAGKSTLVNSLVRASVSPAGVLRPTTRAPVLVCHPNDTPWFRQGRLLPGLTRTSQTAHQPPLRPARGGDRLTRGGDDPQTLRLVAAPALKPGLALLDAPDVDSVVAENRALATQLLAAADLWLFVTTAARYADAVPWELLRAASRRGTVVALVLDRVPDEATDEVAAHLSEMLAANNFGGAPLFVLPETFVDGQGLVDEWVVAPLREWLSRLAADAAARAAVVHQTVDGALAAIRPAVAGLAAAAEDQATTATNLGGRATAAYRAARRTVDQGIRDGAMLRGEVLARWQEFVGTGELLRTLEARVGRLRDWLVAAVTGRSGPGHNLRTALESGLATLIRGAATEGAEQAYAAWQAHPAGSALLRPALARPCADLPERTERLIRDWQHGVLEMVRSEAGDRRATARGAAYAINATGLVVMIGVFASTAFIPTGAEVAVAGGTTIAAQKVLEAIFGDQAIRILAGRAREDLLARVDALLDAEAGRYLALLPTVGLAGAAPGGRLRKAAEDVERARLAAALTASTGPVDLTPPPVSEESPPVAVPAPEAAEAADEPDPPEQADPEQKAESAKKAAEKARAGTGSNGQSQAQSDPPAEPAGDGDGAGDL
jgi:hypothetical protein